ncbi:MAG: hypothetical protein HZA78_05975 [Candidatus Schekmanbacteria bacterium]|nr:hypothetical protein [Candidatus Schekmanbacteria bacterium]
MTAFPKQFPAGLPVKPETLLVQHYQFHGLELIIHSNEADLLSILHNSLKYFTGQNPVSSLPQIHLVFLISDLGQFPQPLATDAKPVSFSGELQYFIDNQLLYTVILGKSLVMCHLSEGWALGYIKPALLENEWIIFQLIFYPVLAELLKQHHIFNVHAALVANQEGQAILLSAPTGRGKSTSMVHLVRNGYKFLSDDISLVKKGAEGLTLLGLPQPVNLLPDAIANFPELGFLQAVKKRCTRSKRSFRIEEVYPDSLETQAVPAWIVFPQVQAKLDTALLPLSKSEALSNLIPQSLVVANRAIVREHLDILAQLVQDCECYCLRLGKAAGEMIPKLFGELTSK